MLSNEEKRFLGLALQEDYQVCIWGAGFVGTQIGLNMLEKRGIKVDYFCDNNCQLWGTEIINGITCISPENLKKRKKQVVCFLMIGVYYYEAVSRQLRDMGIKCIVTFNSLFEEEKENYFPFMKRNKIAIYTCIVGDYDDLQEPDFNVSDCDYFVISDKPLKRKTNFQYIDIKSVLPDNITDNTKKNRYCKINAHKLFPQYRYSIYFDGNIQLKSSITTFVNKMPETRIITWCPSYWKSIYREAMSVLMNKKEREDVILRQTESYWLEGMPEDFGCFMCGILIREHNHPICRKLMREWWEQVEEFSKRDQISFPYVLWKGGYRVSDIGLIVERFEYGLPEGEHWRYSKGHKISN